VRRPPALVGREHSMRGGGGTGHSRWRPQPTRAVLAAWPPPEHDQL